jgi:hypothetical protein
VLLLIFPPFFVMMYVLDEYPMVHSGNDIRGDRRQKAKKV